LSIITKVLTNFKEIARIAVDMSGALEDVVARLKAYQAQMQMYKPKVDELESYHQVKKK